jgi:DNA-binding MarR family transcriptional regulator
VAVKVSRKPAEADHGVGRILKRAEQALLKAKNAALKPVGLTLAQYVALGELERQQGIAAATLARACLVTPQAMMIVLKTMELQGLISRVPHPRHANVLELHISDVGREALHAARTQVGPLEKRVADAYSAKEMATLRDLLARFIEAVGPED